MATQSPEMSPSDLLTIYGGVSAVTYTTTITASDVFSPAGIITLSWPTPSATQAVGYTSIAIPTDPASKYFPNPLPIFVATFVKVFVANTDGQLIYTLIEVPAQPAYVYGASVAGDTGTSCIGSFYTCWSASKRAGVIIAIIIGVLVVLVFLSWLCCFMRIPGSRVPDEKESHGLRRRDLEQGPVAGVDNRRKRVSRSKRNRTYRQDRNRTNRRHSSASSGSYTEPPKPLPRIVTTEDYREERRVSRVPRHARSEASSVSSGEAVVGVGKRDTRRDGMFIPSAEDLDTTTDRRATRAATMATDLNMTTAATEATASKTAPKAGDLNEPQRKLRRSSGNHRDVGRQERGRSSVRKCSSRKPPPRVQSYSPHRRSDSPPTDNGNSFAPYAPLAVAVLEDLWERAERSSPRVVQRSSSVHSTGPERHSRRRSFREDRRTSRQRRHRSLIDQPRRSRSEQQDVSMSGGLEES